MVSGGRILRPPKIQKEIYIHMSKTKIEFTRDNKDYVLEFTADSLKKMEKQGFNFGKIEERVISAMDELFCGLFIENHSDVPRKDRLEIFRELGEATDEGEGIEEVISVMLDEALEELRQHKGNITWRVRK